MKRITAKMLRDAGACNDQVVLFEREWPNGARVTLTNCRRAIELGLNLDWAACRFLPAPGRAVYEQAVAPAWAAYEQAKAAYEQAEAAYEQAEAAYEQAKAAYEQAKAAYEQAWAADEQAKAAYEQAKAPAWAVYEQAWAAYQQAVASAFYEAAKVCAAILEATREPRP